MIVHSVASSPQVSTSQSILCVTGRLAEPLVQRVLAELNSSPGPQIDVHVVGISVAALMHVDWLARKLTLERKYDRVIVPGWCQGDLQTLERQFGIPFERGPREIQDLPAYLRRGTTRPPDLTSYDIEILAEINHAPQLQTGELLRQAHELAAAGADVIDVGCVPGAAWAGIGDAVRQLRDAGLRVSVDSFSRAEVEAAVQAGAELVLSCNATNRDWAADLGVELVVVPDDPHDLTSLWSTVTALESAGARFRVDPILEPIGFGFAASLGRYFEVRRQAPDLALMMGVGNLTEMSAVDSAGVNFLLAAICQELRIHSVLTTQVINWCQSCVRELDLSRRILKHSLEQHTVPKHWTTELVQLRDPRLPVLGSESLERMAGEIKDPNYRIFVERGEIHIFNRDGYWHGVEPQSLFADFSRAGTPLDAAHAFYLGRELTKASIALTLGKHYEQDIALRWGHLTREEWSRHRPSSNPEGEGLT